MIDALVLREIQGGVLRLILNDPARANVLSTPMMAALTDALAGAAADPQVRVIILAAAGRNFCAGHDLAELRATDDQAEHLALFERCSALMMAIVDHRAPIIAEVHGAAVAAGCQLVASCDLAFAATGARFAVSGINLGLFCSTPGVALARQVSRKAASELLMTGSFVSADQAAALGIINRAVNAGDLTRTVDGCAAVIASKPPEAMSLGKRTLRRQIESPLEDAYAIAARAMAENLSFAAARTGIDDFLGS